MFELLCHTGFDSENLEFQRSEDSTLRSAAKARRTPEEILEYQSVDEKVQEICRAFEDETNEKKAAEGNCSASQSFQLTKRYFPKEF